MAYRETWVRVKGGMPVVVSGDVTPDDVGDIELRWYNTGRLVSAGFKRSLSRDDWDRIVDGLCQA